MHGHENRLLYGFASYSPFHQPLPYLHCRHGYLHLQLSAMGGGPGGYCVFVVGADSLLILNPLLRIDTLNFSFVDYAMRF